MSTARPMSYQEVYEDPDFDPTSADIHRGFRVVDIDTADWALRKLARKRAWFAERKDFYDREQDRLRAWLNEARQKLDDDEAFFGSLLADWHRHLLADDDKAKTVKLPAGELKARKSPDTVTIAEPDEFVARHGFDSELVAVSARPDLVAVKRAVFTDGEALAGVEVVPGEVRFTATTAPPILPAPKQAEFSMADDLSVFARWLAAMDEIKAVSKDGEFRSNTANYNFRGIDGVVNAAGPAFRKHGVFPTPTVLEANYREVETGKNRTLMRECTVKVRYRVYGVAGDYFDAEVYGEALDSSDKGTAKATSVAYRIFLLQALSIPTHEADAEEFRPERSTLRDVPHTISAENVDRIRKACEDAGVVVDLVVDIATGGRTSEVAELLTSEVAAAREALRSVTESVPT